jgi:hypothetical protein
VVSIFPLSGSSEGGTNVNVTLREPLPNAVKVAYCRFGSTVVRAGSARGRSALCIAPPHAAEEVVFAFSYDATSWSTEVVRFAFVEEGGFEDLLHAAPAVLGGIAIVTAGVIICCRFAAVADRKEDESGAGVAPLLRNEAGSDDEQHEPFVPKKRGHVD